MATDDMKHELGRFLVWTFNSLAPSSPWQTPTPTFDRGFMFVSGLKYYLVTAHQRLCIIKHPGTPLLILKLAPPV